MSELNQLKLALLMVRGFILEVTPRNDGWVAEIKVPVPTNERFSHSGKDKDHSIACAVEVAYAHFPVHKDVLARGA